MEAGATPEGGRVLRVLTVLLVLGSSAELDTSRVGLVVLAIRSAYEVSLTEWRPFATVLVIDRDALRRWSGAAADSAVMEGMKEQHPILVDPAHAASCDSISGSLRCRTFEHGHVVTIDSVDVVQDNGSVLLTVEREERPLPAGTGALVGFEIRVTAERRCGAWRLLSAVIVTRS